MLLLGIDFTSAPRPRKPISAARGRLRGSVFTLEAVELLPDWSSFEALLRRPGPWLGGFDFPFGMPRELVEDLGWPRSWPDLARYCAGIARPEFRAILDRYRASRPTGRKYAHRATDLPARSSSPMKLVNPPVALMFHEGAPRLLAAGVSIPGLCVGDPQRIALEAYPGLLARSITASSYKNDTPSKQTQARREARTAIVHALLAGRIPLGLRLHCTQPLARRLADDASGDSLDATLCALQAAWGWRRRDMNYGLPRGADALEGWIVTA
jgi:hypothetical protein